MIKRRRFDLFKAKTTSFYGCNFFFNFCISKRRRFALHGFKTASFWLNCHILKTASFWFLLHLNDVVLILHLKKIIINNETTSFQPPQLFNRAICSPFPKLQISISISLTASAVCILHRRGEGDWGRGRVGGWNWISPGRYWRAATGIGDGGRRQSSLSFWRRRRRATG